MSPWLFALYCFLAPIAIGGGLLAVLALGHWWFTAHPDPEEEEPNHPYLARMTEALIDNNERLRIQLNLAEARFEAFIPGIKAMLVECWSACDQPQDAVKIFIPANEIGPSGQRLVQHLVEQGHLMPAGSGAGAHFYLVADPDDDAPE